MFSTECEEIDAEMTNSHRPEDAMGIKLSGLFTAACFLGWATGHGP